MAAVMEIRNSEASWEAGRVLNKLVAEQERQLDNAQHRIVVELTSDRLDLLRDIKRRITVDRAMMRVIPSQAAREAVDEVFRDFEERIQVTLSAMDEHTQKLIAAYADMEEHEEAYNHLKQSGKDYQAKWFGKKAAAREFELAAEKAMAKADAMERVLKLRHELHRKVKSLQQGQERILSLIEEFIERYQDKGSASIAAPTEGCE